MAPPAGPATRLAPAVAPTLHLGGRRHDITHRALVMGILNLSLIHI